MLNVYYRPDEREYQILFDIPIPVDLQQHDQLEPFLTKVSGSGATLVEDKRKNLKALLFKASRLKPFIFSLLTVKEGKFYLSTLESTATQGKLDLPKGLDINFHQKPFDTPNRYWRFILEQGDFHRYFFNRIGWFTAPINSIVTEFPLHVDIETASTCNMDCPMCYRRMLPHTGQMAPELFYKIVDECAAQGVYSIRLSWRGETLSHPEIKTLIAYATRKIPNVSFLTNAFYIDEDMSRCMIDSQLNYVAVSFDGIGKVYEKVRAPANFEESRQKIATLKAMREAAEVKTPQIRLCTIWPAIKDDPDAYYHAMAPVCDYIVYNPYINFSGPMQIKQDFVCQYPWERLVVAYNGDTQCCTGWNGTDIILGNAAQNSLKQMWHSQKMKEIRRLHETDCRMNLESCRECRHGATGKADISIDEIIERKW